MKSAESKLLLQFEIVSFHPYLQATFPSLVILAIKGGLFFREYFIILGKAL